MAHLCPAAPPDDTISGAKNEPLTFLGASPCSPKRPPEPGRPGAEYRPEAGGRGGFAVGLWAAHMGDHVVSAGSAVGVGVPSWPWPRAGVPAASVGWVLSRQRTGMRPEEMTCALPAGQLGTMVEAIEKTSGIDGVMAGYAAEDARRFA